MSCNRYFTIFNLLKSQHLLKLQNTKAWTATPIRLKVLFQSLAQKNSYLHSALTERFVILFRLNTDKFYTFGADGGAAIGIEKQTQDGAGYKLTFTAKSKYPLFEVDNNVLDRVGFVSFWYREDCVSCVQSNGVATGFLQAERMMKVSKKATSLLI